MRQVQVQIAGLPIILVLFSDGCVSLVPVQAFSGILETDESQMIRAWFFPNFFTLTNEVGGEDYDYNVRYLLAEYPVLKLWLKQQNLQSPF